LFKTRRPGDEERDLVERFLGKLEDQLFLVAPLNGDDVDLGSVEDVADDS
jgi:hypothetical protein